MSYILDALKKLEHEKVKKARAGNMSNITGELFSNDKQTDENGGVWKKIVLMTAFASLVTFGATWFFLKSAGAPADKPKTVASAPLPTPISVPSVAAPPPVQAQPVVVPLQPVESPVITPPVRPAVQPKSPPPATAAPISPKVTAKPPSTALPKQQRTVVAKPAVQSSEDTAALITIQELRKRMKDQRGATAPTMAPPPDIKLSGIAWQDDRRARRAVINGFLMQEGGVVSGAKITEILQDRVRFSQAGGVFEISLAASAGMPSVSR